MVEKVVMSMSFNPTKRSNKWLAASLSVGLMVLLGGCVNVPEPDVSTDDEGGSESSEVVQTPEASDDDSAVGSEPAELESTELESAELEERLAAREGYDEVDLDDDDALTQITDPEESVMALFGQNTLEEGQEPSVIGREEYAEYTAMTVTNTGLADDSVRSIRYRVEYEQAEDQLWQVVWVGRQQQCRRGGNPDEWTTQLCP